MKSILSSSNDAMHVMSTFVQSMVQGNAQMAAEQEVALEVATNRFQTRMGDINAMAGETELAFVTMRSTLVIPLGERSFVSNTSQEELVPMFVALNDRQNAIEEVN